MKTIFVKPAEVEHKWYLIDAEGKVLGQAGLARRGDPPRQEQARVRPALGPG